VNLGRRVIVGRGGRVNVALLTADVEISGSLSGAFRREPYTFVADGRTVLVDSTATPPRDDTWQVRVRWPAAPDEADQTVRDLQVWLEDYLLAGSMAAGVPAHVFWGSVVFHRATGPSTVSKSFGVAWSTARADRLRLDSYGGMATAINANAEIRTAAGHARNALGLLQQSAEASVAEAYRAVEGLARSSRAQAWRALGDQLASAGERISGDDVVQLWASCQFFRHEPAMTGRATKTLAKLDRPALGYGLCCWKAVEVIEMYGSARTVNRI
jgi:hypothetical protein